MMKHNAGHYGMGRRSRGMTRLTWRSFVSQYWYEAKYYSDARGA